MGDIIQLQGKKKSPKKLDTTKIDKWVFLDTRLSWAAKGIMTYVLAAGRRVEINELVELAAGDLFINKAIQELFKSGYIDLK